MGCDNIAINLLIMRIISRKLYLRLVEEKDAEFVIQLRTDEKRSKYISTTDVSVEVQRDWINAYKVRENQGKEYYFIGCNNDNKPFGTIRLYNISENSFTYGSWLSMKGDDSRLPILLETLCRLWAFNELTLETCLFDVRKLNKKVNKYHRMFNPEKIDENKLDIFYRLNKGNFLNSLEKFIQLGFYSQEDLKYIVET